MLEAQRIVPNFKVSKMTDDEWVKFFSICVENMGHSTPSGYDSENWCSYLTFSSLKYGGEYYGTGFPRNEEILKSSISDGGIWGEPVVYQDIAHIIIPRSFYWETPCHMKNNKFEHGLKVQDIEKLSNLLTDADIIHNRCKTRNVVKSFLEPDCDVCEIMALDIKLF